MKAIKFLSIILFLGVIAAVGYFTFQIYFWNDIYQAVERQPVNDNDASNGKTNESKFLNYSPKSERPFTILLLGTDSDNLDYGRADTIVLSVVDPENDKIYLLSFPRDTRMEIAGTGNMDKVNHSFNKGVGTTISTIENYLNIPIDYYASVNFNGFIDLIDEMGGITIDVEKDIRFPDRITGQNFSLSKGSQELSGIQALNYARFRSDGEGDFGRNRRQRQVITSMIDQSMDFRNVTKISDMFKILGENARTDLALKEVIKIAFKLKSVDGSDVQSIPMEAHPSSIGGVSYVIVDDSEHERIKTLLDDILKGNQVVIDSSK